MNSDTENLKGDFQSTFSSHKGMVQKRGELGIEPRASRMLVNVCIQVFLNVAQSENHTTRPHARNCAICDMVTICYDLYFGPHGHIGVWCFSKCSYDVIMCGGPLGDVLSVRALCSVYKARCCRSSGLGKKEMSLRHKRTKATQQDLDNHILLYKANGIDYVPHS